MHSSAYPPVTFAFHDSATIPPNGVRETPVDEVGLGEIEARKLLLSRRI
jgi:hypothetical protein